MEHVIVEDFFGGGRISKDGRGTYLLIGRIQGFCYARDIPCTLQPNQMREPCLERAKQMIVDTRGRKGSPHETDAVAHLLAYLERRT